MAVIKIGGSLIEYRKKIVRDIVDFSNQNNSVTIIVPGGGLSSTL